MLDVGFSEILLTSAIALIVLGPEKLPKVARQVGNWVGRARAMARQLTDQLEREVSAEELMKQTKSDSTNKAGAAPISAPAAPISAPAAPISAPAAFDTSYTPNYTPNEPPPAAVPPPASAAPAAYSPETAAAVHGADWHASPPENKPTNE
jgi:sec-independent protein translocase protein TatB